MEQLCSHWTEFFEILYWGGVIIICGESLGLVKIGQKYL
jgi:hypothetical protein